jgi:hypothetical protein
VVPTLRIKTSVVSTLTIKTKEQRPRTWSEIVVIRLPFHPGSAIHYINDGLHLPESQKPQQE